MSTRALRERIETELGIMMPASKESLLQSRLQRRLRELGLESIADYADHLRASPDPAAELRELVAAVTTNTTEFFREAANLSFVAEHVVPQRVAADPYGIIKVWSAGCSSGEEPYSMAMLLAETRRRQPTWDFAVLGTDVSPKVLAQARTGIYEADRTGPIPKPFVGEYLRASRDPARGVVRVVPALRSKVTFAELNFMADAYPITDVFDVILFRNVAIYFDQATQARVVTKLVRHLRPGGYLIVGQTESLLGREVPVQHAGPSRYRKPLRAEQAA